MCTVDAEQPVTLTSREMALLEPVDARAPTTSSTKAQLTDAVYGPSIHVSDRTLDSHLRNLRAKLAEAGLRATQSRRCMGSASGWAPCQNS